jgi:hypothetical protein
LEDKTAIAKGEQNRNREPPASVRHSAAEEIPQHAETSFVQRVGQY